jgi:hypothetical protein
MYVMERVGEHAAADDVGRGVRGREEEPAASRRVARARADQPLVILEDHDHLAAVDGTHVREPVLLVVVRIAVEALHDEDGLEVLPIDHDGVGPRRVAPDLQGEHVARR